jgi:UDP-2-acetamido-3-amino-2,3-dideoxy-glucuronate N-acetyltransferase
MANDFMQHPEALVESSQIGAGTRIWAFAHILQGAVIGKDCNICDHTFIENDVIIGDRVTIKCGAQLWDGLRVEDDVFIGPNATFTNDISPRSKHYLAAYPATILRRGSSIGANATILPGLTIGPGAMVGAGAVVTRSVPANATVVGNPARIVGYTNTVSEVTSPVAVATPGSETGLLVGGASWSRFPLIEDLRGNLSTREVGKGLPFVPQRYFVVMNVPTKHVRGEHAHRKLEQLLVCLNGSVTAVLDDGARRQELLLDSPELGLYIPAMVWGTQYKYTPDAILLVLASDLYDPNDYIRNYDNFLAELQKERPEPRVH